MKHKSVDSIFIFRSRSLQKGAQPSSSVCLSARWGGGNGEEGLDGRGGGQLGPWDASTQWVGWPGVRQLRGQWPNSETRDSAPLLFDTVSLQQLNAFLCGSTYLCAQATKAENTPHYKVLFSGPGPSSVTIGYLPQTQLQRVTGIRVSSQNKIFPLTERHQLQHIFHSSVHSSLIFPLWKITSHISTESVSSCSLGSRKFTLKTSWRTTRFGILRSRTFKSYLSNSQMLFYSCKKSFISF